MVIIAKTWVWTWVSAWVRPGVRGQPLSCRGPSRRYAAGLFEAAGIAGDRELHPPLPPTGGSICSGARRILGVLPVMSPRAGGDRSDTSRRA